MTVSPKQVVRQVVRDALDAGERAGQFQLDAHSKSELENKICDAFEAGKVHDALVLYGAKANTRSQERVLSRIMESALLTLGVSVADAREAWFNELSALATRLDSGAAPGSARESPVRDAFRGISVPLNPTTSQVMRRLALVKARFDASLERALGAEKPVEALRALVIAADLKKLPDQSLMALMTAFIDRECFKDAVWMFENAPQSFQSYAVPIREYALALHMIGRDDDAQLELANLVAHEGGDAIAAGLLGKLFKERGFAFLESGSPREATPWLRSAEEAYRKGFELDRTQLYPGVNLPVVQLALGRLDDAKATARTLLTLAEVRASYGEQNFFDATAALEMNALLGREGEIDKWLHRALSAASEPWQRLSVTKSLDRLAAQLESRGASTVALRKAGQALSAVTGSKEASSPAQSPSEAALALSEIQKVTYRFGARHARRLTGNYQFSGIAHDVRVTPADLRLFTRIVIDQGWDYISGPRAVSKAIDEMVRARFDTAKLENINSPEHQVFDQTMPGLAKFMGAKENSQTNVSADWLNGLGDCRQHAPTKLLLFEAWKRSRTDYLLERLLAANLAKNRPAAARFENDLAELARYEMRVMDALVVGKGKGELIEEHTLTVLSKRKPPDARGEMNELESLQLADSFYHQVHAFAEGELTISRTATGLELGVPKPSANGSLVSLLPAPYSRDRSTSSPDFGQLEFRGIQVATPGWEREVPTEGLDLSPLHGYARLGNSPAS